MKIDSVTCDHCGKTWSGNDAVDGLMGAPCHCKPDRMELLTALTILFDTAVNFGLDQASAKLEAYRNSRRCRTERCIGLRGHFGPCFDGSYVIPSSLYKSKVKVERKKP